MSKLKIRDGDQWTEIPAGGVGVPSGGTTGQVLTKSSNTDYATEWNTLQIKNIASLSQTVSYSGAQDKMLTFDISSLGIPSDANPVFIVTYGTTTDDYARWQYMHAPIVDTHDISNSVINVYTRTLASGNYTVVVTLIAVW